MRTSLETARVAFMLVVLSLLSACASVNPLAAADSVEQRAFAVRGMYVIVREQLADLVSEDSSVPEDTQRRLIGIGDRIDPVIDDMTTAFNTYVNVRSQFEGGQSTARRLMIATRNLEDIVESVVPLIESFSEAVGKGEE